MASSRIPHLPNEILLMIVEFIAEEAENDTKQLLDLCHVNRTFLDLTQPFLYHKVLLSPTISGAGVERIDSDPTLDLFHRSLSDNRALGELVDCLDLTFEQPDLLDTDTVSLEALLTSTNWAKILDIMSWLPNVKDLMLGDALLSPLNSVTWRLCAHSIPYMTKVRQLTIPTYTRMQSPQLIRLLQPLKFLRRLGLVYQEQGSPCYDPFSLEAIPYHGEYTLDSMEFLAVQGEIDGAELVKYCPTLQLLKLGDFSLKDESSLVPIPDMQTMLTPVMHSLRSLVIDLPMYPKRLQEIHRPKLRHLKICELPNIQMLWISNWMIDDTDTALAIYNAFLAGTVVAFQWTASEHHQGTLIHEIYVEVIKDALVYAANRDTYLQEFTLELTLSANRAKVATVIEKKLEALEASLLQQNIDAECKVQARDMTEEELEPTPF